MHCWLYCEECREVLPAGAVGVSTGAGHSTEGILAPEPAATEGCMMVRWLKRRKHGRMLLSWRWSDYSRRILS